MSHSAAFDAAFADLPLVAILRGVHPDEVIAVAEILVDEGIRLIEVPLNSPTPFDSIARLSVSFVGRAVIGAGTVLTRDAVDRVRDAGGTMVVSPNTDTRVIERTVEHGMIALPGFATPSEAFSALAAGAVALKLFPAEGASPEVLKALRAVLPAGTRVLPVGGITADTMLPWVLAGAAGFGLGSSLYRPGIDLARLRSNAKALVAAWRSTGSGS